VVFDPTSDGSRIVLASGDFRTEWKSEGGLAPDALVRLFLEQPTLVRETAAAFIDAGASVLVTPTDGINHSVLEREDSRVADDELSRANKSCTEQFREAAARSPEQVLVFGAMGPVDRLIALSEVSEEELEESYSRQSRALAEGGIDAVLCRGFCELESLRIALRAARRATGLPVIGSMVFDSGADYSQTTLGATIAQACTVLTETGAVMAGCDGSEYPDGAPAIVTLLTQACNLPIYAEVTPGRAELTEAGVTYPDTPKEFGERFDSLVESGARIISGGRGASAKHIAELAKAAARLEKRRAKNR
ncbi:MAG TPA: homocysteine S-methyltransferase family protein, partial [Phycisphaerae bacterium]|nr:homocysteine S-methyltransferase family protein [Phycisphaerae bacterium]